MTVPIIRRRGVRLALRAALTAAGEALAKVRLELTAADRLGRHCRGRRELLLHVACGPGPREGWINLDIQPSSPEVFYLDVVNGLPLDDGSVRHIHAEHFLEHLPLDDGARFLKECWRVLAPGGTARIIVPDAEIYMRAYVAEDGAFFSQLAGLGGASPPLETPVEVCNQAFRMGGEHRFAWDFQTLSRHARAAGFSEVSRSAHHAVPAAYDIDGDDWWRPVESLYTNLAK